jgi:hypothetical protein
LLLQLFLSQNKIYEMVFVFTLKSFILGKKK